MLKKKWLALLLTVAMGASVLAGCGGSKAPAGDTQQPAGGPDKEQFLNLPSVADLASLDSAIIDDGYSFNALNACMEGLVRTVNKGDKDELEAAGAKEWKTSEDGLTWTFTLRDHNWTDDKPVTAHDYVFAIRRLLNKDVAAPYSYLFYGIKNAVAYNNGEAKDEDLGVKAIDDKTLEFKLEYPIPYFLSMLAMKVTLPQREDIVTAQGTAYGQDPKTMVFNGPFVAEDWVHGNKIIFKKNPKFWNADAVKLNEVTINVIKEETPRMTMLKDGQIDAGTAKGAWVKELTDTGKFEIVNGILPSTTYEIFNSNVAVFKSPKVKLAMSLALDREDIVKTLYEGRYKPALGWVPDGIVVQSKINYRQETKEPLLAAKEQYTDIAALFKEGLKDLGMDPEKPVTIKYLASGTDSTSKLFSEYRQKQWESKLPVKIELDAVNDFPEFIKRLSKQEFELAGLRWSGDYNDPMTFLDFFQTDYDGNYGKYSNKEFDGYIQQSVKESDPQKRFELFQKAEEVLLVKDPGIAPGVYFDKMTFVSKYVKDLQLPMFGADWDFTYAYTEGRQ